ncbi:MAG: hypothetical protein CMI54_00675 [Parcubacteria group bacterium]|jgi:hypothetical protein|nr:hypothetical protein [Parcubacteria group bacterium]|tara:strand:- start:1950 stop:3242 length:1293 start_codon:yes stop_codon:yes gene_type:complete
MATYVSPSAGSASAQGVALGNTRRMFNFGERIAELAPQQSPFFTYLSKVAKKPTDDPVFKFLEQRHQWQRRNFDLTDAVAEYTAAVGDEKTMNFDCGYDQFGNVAAGSRPEFFIPGQVIALQSKDDGILTMKIKTVDVTNAGYAQLVLIAKTAGTYEFSANAKGQVIGSAWAEGETAPSGWEDKLFDREGYTQIFKTGMNLFSGTAMATRYRGIADEYKRVWQEKLMEHKMDLEHAMLFGVGGADESSAAPLRYTWGIVPYTESNGKIYNMTYASSGYDAFLDAMEDFFAPESGNSGNKLVMASRKVLTYLNKLGSGSFMNNTVGSSQYRLDVANVPGKFGHNVTVVNTIYGNLHFVAEPLLRGIWENYCVAVDMKNVAYRPLVGNGQNRDTSITTNIQADDVDGRKDMILTEAGLEISLPETHAILKFS